MTTDITADNRRSGRGLFLWLLVASFLVHVLLVIVAGPWLYSRMELNRRAEETRAEEVKQREHQRQLSEAARRERMQLSQRQAATLRAEQERRQSQVLRERLHQLEQIAREMLRVRDQQLDKLHERTEAEIVMSRINKLRQLADGTTHKAENVKGYSQKRPELKDYLDDQAQRRTAQLNTLARSPEDYQAYARDLADLARKQFDELTHQQEIEPDGGQRYRMKKVKESLTELADEADKLAAGVDVQGQNDTTAVATNFPDVQLDRSANSAELYQTAVDVEKRIQDDFNINRAAELAQTHGTSMSDAMSRTRVAPPDRPDLSHSLEDADPETVGDFDRFRQALEQASRETADIQTRSIGLLAQAGGQSSQSTATAPVRGLSTGRRGMVISQAARGDGRRVVDMTGLLAGGVGANGYTDSEGLRIADFDSGIRDTVEAMRLLIGPELRINPDVAQRNALPGRAFTDSSQRRGWLFIDTWYVIGPWENDGRLRHDLTHPPEQVIDFDAEYSDGKFAAVDGHVQQRMRWRFYQSDQIRCQPPRVYNDSTYYAYTEISSDREREVLLTISTDDAAKAWLNGQVVWEDVGLSPWTLGEGFRRVPLQRGYNTLLVRIENGPTHCVWSVLMCPIELTTQHQ